jgi:predicted deacylase
MSSNPATFAAASSFCRLPIFPLPSRGARVSPLDSGNLNRAIPGEPDTTPTRRIAHYIDSVLVPMCSAWLDLHSGGSSLDYLPFAAFYERGDESLDSSAGRVG